MRRLFALLIGLVCLAGCGGDDEATAPEPSTISKAQFVRQANAVCKKQAGEITAALDGPADSPAEYNERLREKLLPPMRTQIEGLRALGLPKGDEDRVSELLDDFQAVVDVAEQDPDRAFALSGGKGTFSGLYEDMQAYGLDGCIS